MGRSKGCAREARKDRRTLLENGFQEIEQGSLEHCEHALLNGTATNRGIGLVFERRNSVDLRERSEESEGDQDKDKEV